VKGKATTAVVKFATTATTERTIAKRERADRERRRRHGLRPT
jgi:hypothetical protein